MTTDAQILKALHQAGTDGIPGTELSSVLRISRAAIWARIEHLRAFGYVIEASPHQGYRLLEAPDRLHADDLQARIGQTEVIGRHIRVISETTSTNDLVEGIARDGGPDGLVVFAESQTQGRGRLGRRWVSPFGRGLWLSVLLRPRLRPPQVTQVMVISATALVRSIQRAMGLETRVKWPNDILCGDRKVAGVLTEMSAEPDRVRHVVLGIGMDVNQSRDDFPAELWPIATSLRMESGQTVNRARLAAILVRELDRDYARIRAGRFREVSEEWESVCSTLGRDVVIDQGGWTLQGVAESLDSDGALLIRTPAGRLQKVTGGDVTIQRK